MSLAASLLTRCLNGGRAMRAAAFPVKRRLAFGLTSALVPVLVPVLLPVLAPMPALAAADGGYVITTVSGMAYGPGPMVATPITDGRFTHVAIDARLAGKIDFFNNGPAEPNIPGEALLFGAFRGGKLSNGVPFNEHLHGGIVEIGQGALRMLAVVASDGPNRGGETYRLDERLNWQLRTDLALDPGYPEGLVVTYDLAITSGVRWVPPSLQTETGTAGGFDHADRLPAGAPVVGRLGDADGDGRLDARIVGVSRVPLAFLFVPGAPIVMTRDIVSDVPVSARAAGLLELAGVANLALMLDPPDGAPPPGSPLAAFYAEALPGWATEFAARAERAAAQLAAPAGATAGDKPGDEPGDDPSAALATRVATTLTAAAAQAGDPAAYRAAVGPALAALVAALPDLHAAFLATTEASLALGD